MLDTSRLCAWTILFLIYINDFVNASSVLDFHFFAYYSNLFYSHRDLKRLEQTVNQELVKINIAQCKVIRIPESKKFSLVESKILGSGIWNPALGIRNPSCLKIHFKSGCLESEIHSMESRIQDYLGFPSLGD